MESVHTGEMTMFFSCEKYSIFREKGQSRRELHDDKMKDET